MSAYYVSLACCGSLDNAKSLKRILLFHADVGFELLQWHSRRDVYGQGLLSHGAKEAQVSRGDYDVPLTARSLDIIVRVWLHIVIFTIAHCQALDKSVRLLYLLCELIDHQSVINVSDSLRVDA